ncbi:MAG: metalloregulator ArsR/SmtB family transcription factor [Eubacterium sp.]|nr:metalloregulator ArsR/SmtB family transcription factor [Eubacterium sp.]MDE7124249.1 metalloregulator ArsR/SmtB family transcription factor [Eubacterium sp.]
MRGVHIMNEELVYDLADLFKIFSDSTRVKVLCSLFEKELNVTEITAVTGVSQTAVSHQLRILKQNHLVKYKRDGKQMVYSLADEHVKTIINCGIEHIEE